MPESNKFEIAMTSISSEVNRARDWPLRILTFTSVLHFGLIVAVVSLNKTFSCLGKLGLSAFFTVLMLWTIYYFLKCHVGYLQLRNAQRRLQRSLGIKEGEIFPHGWLEEEKVVWQNRFWGWGYYAFIALSFWAALLTVVWFPQVTTGT